MGDNLGGRADKITARGPGALSQFRRTKRYKSQGVFRCLRCITPPNLVPPRLPSATPFQATLSILHILPPLRSFATFSVMRAAFALYEHPDFSTPEPVKPRARTVAFSLVGALALVAASTLAVYRFTGLWMSAHERSVALLI